MQGGRRAAGVALSALLVLLGAAPADAAPAGASPAGSSLAGAPPAGGSLVGALAAGPLSARALLAGDLPAGDPLAAPGMLAPPGAAVPPPVPATAWIVADLEDGDVLAAQNARSPLAPASTLKLLTALALGPDLPDDTVWTASSAAADTDGSKVGVRPGSLYTVGDLLHGLLLGSGNDCAQALAELSGGMPAAGARMTALARDLGATDTVVANTSGLDAPGQVSSARDLAVIGRAALHDDRVAALVTTSRYQFPGAGTTFGPERPRFEVGNHNRLLGAYQGALGLKNGYTDAARGSFVGAAERDGRRYVVAVLHAEGPTWRHAADLLDWAFATPADLSPVGSLDPRAPSGRSPAQAPAARDRVPADAALGDGAAPAPAPRRASDAGSEGTAAAPGEPADSAATADAQGGSSGPPGLPGGAGLVVGLVLALGLAVVVGLRARVLLRRRR